jgi:hypothetical protein
LNIVHATVEVHLLSGASQWVLLPGTLEVSELQAGEQQVFIVVLTINVAIFVVMVVAATISGPRHCCQAHWIISGIR